MVAFYSLFGVSAAAHAAPITVVGNTSDLQTELSSPTGDVKLDGSISAPATLTINAGTVTATGGERAAGIGGGYSGDGGTVTISSGAAVTVVADGDRTLTTPTRTGFSFDGWNTAPDGSGNTFALDTTLTDDTTVYAQWTEDSTPTEPGDGTDETPADDSDMTPVASTDDDPTLAATGTDLAPVGFAGGVALLAGLALLLVCRHRHQH